MLTLLLIITAQHPAVGQQATTPGAAPERQQTDADSTSARIEKLRAQAVARRNGRRVRVESFDGTVTRGRVVGVMDRTMAVQPTPSDEPVLFDFANVKSIDGPGLPRRVWIALGVAGTAAVVAGVIAMGQ